VPANKGAFWGAGGLKLAFSPCLRQPEFFQSGHRSSVIENKQHNHNTTTMRAATTLATLATAVFSALPASSGFEIVEDHRNLQVAGDEEAARALMHVVSEIHFTVILIEIILYYDVFLPFPGSSYWNAADERRSIVLFFVLERSRHLYFGQHYSCNFLLCFFSPLFFFSSLLFCFPPPPFIFRLLISKRNA
jgi:hypothetical protein